VSDNLRTTWETFFMTADGYKNTQTVLPLVTDAKFFTPASLTAEPSITATEPPARPTAAPPPAVPDDDTDADDDQDEDDLYDEDSFLGRGFPLGNGGSGEGAARSLQGSIAWALGALAGAVGFVVA